MTKELREALLPLCTSIVSTKLKEVNAIVPDMEVGEASNRFVEHTFNHILDRALVYVVSSILEEQ